MAWLLEDFLRDFFLGPTVVHPRSISAEGSEGEVSASSGVSSVFSLLASREAKA